MSLEDYLKQNIKPEVLEEVYEFQNSSKYKQMQTYSKSKKYQTARTQLKLRDKDIHKNTLSDIQKLQDKILIG